MLKFLQILCIITLVGFAALPLTLRGAAVVTADGVEIDIDHSDAESLATIEDLRALDNQITTLFRVSGKRLPRRCRIEISAKAPPNELLAEFKPREWRLAFNDRAGAWRGNFPLWRRLVGLMLLAKIPNANVPPSLDFLPGWVAAGIASRLRSSHESELLLSRNRYFPVLRALAEQGRFPDFRQMRRLAPELLAPPAMGWYRELSRALLECGFSISSSADNALLDYCLLAARPGSIEEQNFKATLGRLLLSDSAPEGGAPPLSDAEKLQRKIERFARQLAFSEFFPQPAHLTRAAFEQAMKIELPVLDSHGKPTGETAAAELADLPELLPGRRDALELRATLRRRLLALRPGSDRAFRSRIADLSETLMLLPLAPKETRAEPSPYPEQFRRQIEQIRAGLDWQERIEKELFKLEIQLSPPGKFYGEAILEAQRPSPVLSTEARRFLEQIEAEWLED